ncbi:MAG: acyl-CoA thioesterase [Bacillota bacterium]|nr:MAG: acyl-CoA thioesterase [Bacillota bacterium]
MVIDFKTIQLTDYPVKTFEKIRYADLDRQGHVNNAIFSTFLETGRVEILRDLALNEMIEKSEFVIANLNLNFINEINWPGTVEIGTGIINIGQSSIKLIQSIFQESELKATAESVIVQVDMYTKKSKPLSDAYKSAIEKYVFNKK